MSSPHESAARSKKVAALTATLAAASEQLTPVTRLRAMLDLSDRDWARAAVVSGCRPASAETRHDVLVGFARLALLTLATDLVRQQDLGQWDSMARACNLLTTGEPKCPVVDAYNQLCADVDAEMARAS